MRGHSQNVLYLGMMAVLYGVPSVVTVMLVDKAPGWLLAVVWLTAYGVMAGVLGSLDKRHLEREQEREAVRDAGEDAIRAVVANRDRGAGKSPEVMALEKVAERSGKSGRPRWRAKLVGPGTTWEVRYEQAYKPPYGGQVLTAAWTVAFSCEGVKVSEQIAWGWGQGRLTKSDER
jgi:hypothetical protein